MKITGDSRLVIRRLTGEYTRPLVAIDAVLSEKASHSWSYSGPSNGCPGEENTVADALSEKAYTEYWMKKTGRVPATMRQRGAIA